MRISVVVRSGEWSRYMANVVLEQLPFARAVALNATAQDVVKAEQDAIRAVFDRPTRYTLKAIMFPRPNWATKERPTATVQIGGFDATNHFLNVHVDGGVRQQKRFEKLLQDAGVMPPGWVSVPGKGAKLNAYGNLPSSTIVQILSATRSFNLAGFTANRTARSKAKRSDLRNFFVSGPVVAARAKNGGRLPFGIWERTRKGIISNILLFVKRATYRRRLDFYGIAQQTVDRVWPVRWQQAFDKAISTAK